MGAMRGAAVRCLVVTLGLPVVAWAQVATLVIDDTEVREAFGMVHHVVSFDEITATLDGDVAVMVTRQASDGHYYSWLEGWTLTGFTFGYIESEVYQHGTQIALKGRIGRNSYSANFAADVGFLDSLWFGLTLNTLIAQEGESALEPDDYWSFASSPCETSGPAVWFIGGTTSSEPSPDGSSRTEEVALYRWQGGAITRILGGGDLVAGLPGPLDARRAFGPVYAVSADGAHWLARATFTDGGQAKAAILRSGQLVTVGGQSLIAGAPVAATGALPGEVWTRFYLLDINASGEWVIAGSTSDGTDDYEVVLRGDTIYRRTGDTVDGAVLAGRIDAAAVNAEGDTAYAWKETEEELAVLLVNNRVVLALGGGVDLDGDRLVDTTTQFIRPLVKGGFYISDRDAEGICTLHFLAEFTVLEPGGLKSHTGLFRMPVDPDGTGACVADFDGDGELTFFDYLAFQNAYQAGDLAADLDGDGSLTFFDYLMFQNEFAAGCH